MLRIVAAVAAGVSAGNELGFNMHFTAPEGSDSFPVILFVTGFSGLAPDFTYSDFVGKVTDKGYIVVGLDHVKAPNYPAQGQDFHNIMEWVAAGNLTAALRENGIDANPDLDRVAVMGQSAGNHVVGQGLTDGCSLAKAQIMIDPVDGFDPFGMVHSEDLITPGEKLKYTTPTLLLDNELDPKHKLLMPSCAPAKLGAPRWFDATAGPLFNVNASKYGHVDCLNNFYITAGNLICPTDRTTDKDAYKAHLASSIDTFLSGLFEGQQEAAFQKLEDPSSFGVDVTLRQDLKGMSHSAIKPGCTNQAVIV